MWITYRGYGTDRFLYTAGLCSVRTQCGPDHRLPRDPVTFCPLLTTDAGAGRRKPWGLLACPLLCSLLGVSLGGGWSPAASGQWWGCGLRPPSTFSGWQRGTPAAALQEENPAKVTKGIVAPNAQKGRRRPQAMKKHRVTEPRPLCAARPSSCWSARPSGLVPSSSSTPTCHPALVSPPAAGTVRHPAPGPRPTSRLSHQNLLPCPSQPHFPGLCGLQQGAHHCSTLGTSFRSPRHSLDSHRPHR